MVESAGMTWATAGPFIVATLAGGVVLGIPLLCAALGEAFAERSGVLNVGIEGIMLLGGFVAFATAVLTESLWIGVAGGILTGVVIGIVFSISTVTFGANQIVCGFALILLGLGTATYLNRLLFSDAGLVPRVSTFKVSPIPVLADLPVLGRTLFSHGILTYSILLLIPISTFVLFHTPFGIRITAVGEAPDAADAAGLNVNAIRHICIVISGCLGGLAGAQLALEQLGLYTETMVSGRGFIALALVAFGRWHPGRIAAAALLFGTIDSLQARLQAIGVPIAPPLLLMLPYVLTVAILLFAGSRAAPSALTVPYSREDSSDK
jgi:general nucleoside transport system permease protein